MTAIIELSVLKAFGDPLPPCNWCGHAAGDHTFYNGKLRCTKHEDWATGETCDGPRVLGPTKPPYRTLAWARWMVRNWVGYMRVVPDTAEYSAAMLFADGEEPSWMAVGWVMILSRNRFNTPFCTDQGIELRHVAETMAERLVELGR